MPILSQEPALGTRHRLDVLERIAYRAGRALGRLERAVARLPVPRPWMVLGVLVVADWLVTIEAGRIAAHRGWLYYDGGDSTWYYTTAWVLAHGHIPQGTIGYGYSLAIAPLTVIAGPSLAAGLPLIVFLNAIVLAPIALLCIYALSKAIGGLRFAYAASAVWVILPLAAIRYFLPPYHSRYVDATLPSAVGLTGLGDYPSMVCLLVAVYFAYRALSSRSALDALTAGLAAGIALGVKPANALFLPAPFIALALARRWRQAAFLAAGIVPSLLALVLWKYRGLGTLPAFSGSEATLATGVHSAIPVGSFPVHLGKYLHLNWAHLRSNLDSFREYGWSQRLLEWLTIGGLIGLARRSITGAVLVGVWLAAYLLVKGSVFSIYAGDFFTHVLPAFPAFFLLGVSFVFLLPVFGRRRLAASATASWPQSRRARRGAIAVLGFLAVIPIGVIALLPPLTQPAAADVSGFDLYIPVNRFPLTATRVDGRVRLSWPIQQRYGTPSSYFIFRTSSADGLNCVPMAHAATQCLYTGGVVGVIPARRTVFYDNPGTGRWSYRVALAAGAFGPAGAENPLFFSSPVTVVLPP